MILAINLIESGNAKVITATQNNNFHFVFEEVGLMAGSTDYQLSTMKVNLTQLIEGVKALQKSIERQKKAVREFGTGGPRGVTQSLFPNKQRLEESLEIHLQDAELLQNRIEHLKNVLPQVEKSRPGKILSDDSNINTGQSRRQRSPQSTNPNLPNTRNKRFLIPFLWGIIGTYKGILTDRKYEKLSKSLEKTNTLVQKVVDIVNNQERNIKAITSDLERMKDNIDQQSILNSLNIETSLRSSQLRLTREVNRITGALQAAQYRRLSIDFLSTKQLNELYEKMILAAEHSSSELLVSQPSDLLQLELSYFFDGEIITFLLHVPTVPFGAMLRLVKLHPFPLPLSGNYSIIPDVSEQILAISESDTPMYLQFPSVNLLGCNQASHVYLCEKLGALDKKATQTCLGALHSQNFEVARILCPMKIVTSGEISFRLNNNEHLVYSPVKQTITIHCPPGADTKKNTDIWLQEGVNQFHLAPGCRTELREHFLFADNSITSDSGFEHITLSGDSMLDIPHITSEGLDHIMAQMKEDGLFRPTVNDIIETSDHLEQLSTRTSLNHSIIGWTTSGIIFLSLIAFIYYLYYHLSAYRTILFKQLAVKTHSALLEIIPSFISRILESNSVTAALKAKESISSEPEQTVPTPANHF